MDESKIKLIDQILKKFRDFVLYDDKVVDELRDDREGDADFGDKQEKKEDSKQAMIDMILEQKSDPSLVPAKVNFEMKIISDQRSKVEKDQKRLESQQESLKLALEEFKNKQNERKN
jgi:hypothetical protein